MSTIISAEALEAALPLARGSYQRDLLRGRQRWSGSDLRGRAARYGAHYARSRRSLLRRLEAGGFRVGWAPGRMKVAVIELPEPVVQAGAGVRFTPEGGFSVN